MSWVEIPNFNGLYQISKDGEVRSIQSGRWKTLKQGTSDRGYKTVQLHLDKKKFLFKVHRLIAIAFIPNPENKKEVNHINCNKLDNSIENLEWCSRKENMSHALKNNLLRVVGSKNPRSKLKESDVEDIVNGISDGFLHKDIAKYYGVHVQHIGSIARGELWQHTTGIKKK